MTETKTNVGIKAEEPKDELIQWFEDLYEKETFEIEYHGRVFKFKKYFPISIMTKLEKLDNVVRTKYLMSFISIEPKITMSATEYLPADLVKLIGSKINKFNNYSLGESPATSP